jgi:dTDP-D-glucose 4,6-dehydratase
MRRSACWFVRHLVLTYPHYNVVSFDKLDYCATLNNTRILDGRPNFAFEHGDITSPSDVKRVLRKHQIDTIFHFAAQSHVDLSFGNSYQFTNTNVYGTHVLLERARQHSVNRFIHISTDEVYGDVPVGAADLSEASILAPTNPYSASKAAAEMMVSAYRSSFKLPLITVRANNVYGPHQFPESRCPVFNTSRNADATQRSYPSSLCCFNGSRSCCFTATVPQRDDTYTQGTL